MLSLRIYDDLLFSRKPFFTNIPGRFIAHRPSVVLRHPSVSCACQENSSCAFRDAIIIFFIYVYNLYSPSSVVIFLGNEGVSSVQCWYSYQKQKPPTPCLWEIVLFQYIIKSDSYLKMHKKCKYLRCLLSKTLINYTTIFWFIFNSFRTVL